MVCTRRHCGTKAVPAHTADSTVLGLVPNTVWPAGDEVVMQTVPVTLVHILSYTVCASRHITHAALC